ncbi:MAG TPA: ATP-binding protein [Iamia sp.]|nr:ATP-binding protein [Iamia sp.]
MDADPPGPHDRRRTHRPARPDTVAARLRRPLVLFVLAAVVVTAAGLSSLVVADRALEQRNEEIDPLRAANRDVLDAVLDADTELRGYRLTWDEGFLPAYRTARARQPEAAARAEALTDDAVVREALAAQAATFAEWGTYADEVERLGATDHRAAEALVRTGRGRALIDRIRTENDRAAARIDTLDERIADRSRRIGTVAGLVTVGVLVAATLLGLVANRRTRRSVVEPLERLHATIGRHRGGDRTARAEIAGAEEVRAVSAAFNRLAAADAELAERQEAQLAQERRVRELGRQIRATLDPAAVVRLTADALGPATGADRVAIRPVADVALGALETEWTHEAATPTTAGAPLVPHPALLAHVHPDLAAGRTVLLEDTAQHPELPPEALAVFTEAGWGSVALVPVTEDGEVRSLIVLEARARGHRWPPDAIRLAEAVASEMALARHTARLFAQERAMVERLREIDQAKSDFVSSVSHELRTPLTSIRGYVEMLQDGDGGPLAPGQRRMLDVVERNTDRLLALIEDLLTLSRIESGAFRTTLADIDLGALLRGCADVVAVQARAAGVDLDVAVADDLPGVRGDAHQLERVVLNLLTNAIKFSDAGSTVRLRAERAGDSARIEVADEGMGIPEAEQARLFSRFFRSSTAQERAVPGTGLGLVIAKTAVDNHGGSIAVDSTPGRGTTFTVVLPGQPHLAAAR